ncbi:hypothetical protein COB52_05470 [Candidatus Kaiserbacteria bacterium]|nr:MAG: hypothetical protein COB52_05470 [Candidatus Kaiserbacteria bacterium]
MLHQRADFKNIQRRVYDALNVLTALNIITKLKNKIHFEGFQQIREDSEKSIKMQVSAIYNIRKSLPPRGKEWKRRNRNFQN